MKKAIILIFLIFLACSLFKKEEEVMPLEVGNWWAYQITEEGKLMSKELKNSLLKKFSKSPATYIDTMKLVGKQTIKDVDGYVAFSTYNKDTIGIFYYKNDYLWLHHPGEDTFTEKVFPQKPKIGDKWIGWEVKIEDIDYDGDEVNDSMWVKIEYTIVVKENITVLAGSFKDCYRTQISGFGKVWLSSDGQWQTIMTLSGNYWIKAGIGLIKQEITGFETWELTGYKVK